MACSTTVDIFLLHIWREHNDSKILKFKFKNVMSNDVYSQNFLAVDNEVTIGGDTHSQKETARKRRRAWFILNSRISFAYSFYI
jgi:hypothetical protein